jgi:hypothetical protein
MVFLLALSLVLAGCGSGLADEAEPFDSAAYSFSLPDVNGETVTLFPGQKTLVAYFTGVG